MANLVRHAPSTHQGVVLFRPGSLGRRSVLEFVGDRLPALPDFPLEGKIMVVTDRGIRSR